MLFGPGTVAQIGELVEFAGYKKPFIVCDPGIVATGLDAFSHLAGAR